MISMKEIAAEAGVSRTTVSFVLNGRYERDLKISTEVVEKVKRTAEKLGYVRNELVQSLVKGKSKVIAIIAHFSDFMMPIIRGYSETAAKYGYSISLISLNENCTLNQALMTAVEYRVSGIAVMTLEPEEKAQVNPGFFQYGIPVSGLDANGKSSFDQEGSAEVAVNYLISLGHRKIICLGQQSVVARQRIQGYLNIMEKNGLPPCILEDDSSHLSVHEAVVEANPDAVFCVNDPLALSLLQYLYHRRIFVPDAFSVVGFGNLGAELASPSLTTIREPYYETGCRGFENLYSIIRDGRKSLPKKRLVGELIIRESTAKNNKYGG